MKTEPIGSIPRPLSLIEAIADFQLGHITREVLQRQYEAALQETIERFAATGSPIVTDGEQTKPSFATYPLSGLENLAPDGLVIPFADGHTRQLPRLTKGPFKYSVHAAEFTLAARAHTSLPIKQAVISASALSLLYPASGLADYPRDQFIADLIKEAETDIRGALEAGAAVVQIDFTEARLSLKLDPSGALLRTFIELNNQVLDRFTEKEREQIGVHVCPGSDRDSPHSADVDYAGLIPELFQMQAGRLYLQMASERDKPRVLQIVKNALRPNQLVFIGVIDPIDPVVETVEQVRNSILQAAAILPIEQLGTTDDCGFAPFADDTSTAREIAFHKIRARVQGTSLAAQELGIASMHI